jgi:SAM-dependent methyltransferase
MAAGKFDAPSRKKTPGRQRGHGWNESGPWMEIADSDLYPPIAIEKREGFEKLVVGENLAGKDFLDHGCGTGRFGILAKERGARVTGIDISDMLLEKAREHFEVHKTTMNQLPFPDARFDVLLSFMVIHITKDIEKPIGEIVRVLKPGGKLLLGVVHPFAEKWRTVDGTCYEDNSTYGLVEQRPWVFNLTDGRKFTAMYYHRPLESYLNALGQYFQLETTHEPTLPPAYAGDNRYASREFLFTKWKRL